MTIDVLDHVEQLLRRDPGSRGLAAYRNARGLLAAGDLKRALASLTASATHVAIVTGFCIPAEQGWTAETDGPPGALFLARALLELGIEVRLISDDYGRPLLESGADCWQLPRAIIEIMPFESPHPDDPARFQNGASPTTDAWVERFLSSSFGNQLSHMIAIERCGPSHTTSSFLSPPRTAESMADAFSFHDLVPYESTNRCHNMRGQCIDAHTAKSHRLFEMLANQGRHVTTIGVADGGNEIGVGSLHFFDVLAALGKPESARIICRIPTDHVLLAGISNWGGYGLGLGICHARNQLKIAQSWRSDGLSQLIESLVQEAGAVDGVSRQHITSVDGLPLPTYLAHFKDLRSAFGLG